MYLQTMSKNLIILFCFSLVYCVQGDTDDCLLKDYGDGKKVCVCNSEHCDFFYPNIESNKINVITSTQKGARYLTTVQDIETKPNSQKIAQINREKKYQSIIGWGGALTDSAAINIKSLPPRAADNLMRSYFTARGSMYNLCRVPMGGTDFSTRGYSYDDGPEDKELTNFKLAPEDFELKMPLMRAAQNWSMYQTKLKFFTSTWTAPKWMKENGDYYGPNGFLKKEFFPTWAKYFLKFLEAYRNEGLDFWGITTGNEPILTTIPGCKINSVQWDADSASLWVREHLGPTLRNSEFSDINIMAIDDQRLYFPEYASQVMENSTTRNYINGFSVHWYADLVVPPTVLSDTHDKFPDKFFIVGEASNGWLPSSIHVDIGSWERLEKYASDIIENLNHWVSAWVDWNLVLDLQGGPTYINNYVDSAILVNASAGEFYKQPMYYAIGHFSKFIPEDSVRIDVSSNFDDIPMVAFITPEPENYTVLVLLNKYDNVTALSIQDGESYINLNLEGKSITTVIFTNDAHSN